MSARSAEAPVGQADAPTDGGSVQPIVPDGQDHSPVDAPTPEELRADFARTLIFAAMDVNAAAEAANLPAPAVMELGQAIAIITKWASMADMQAALGAAQERDPEAVAGAMQASNVLTEPADPASTT